MADRATEILDGCTHGNLADPERTVSLPCRPCALRAIEAAREEEKAEIKRLRAFAKRVAEELAHFNAHGDECSAAGYRDDGGDDSGTDPGCDCFLALRVEARRMRRRDTRRSP